MLFASTPLIVLLRMWYHIKCSLDIVLMYFTNTLCLRKTTPM